ncbi:MAG TPA: hypothetical protein VGR82_18100 [Methylomirabilota bacterium]|jgi:hypothetical protein|nr:hypothetical protein [Methylomirabilota bacterium]
MRESVATTSNVYYLPASAPAFEPRRAPTRWILARAHARRAWWRLRFAMAGIRLALRPSRTPLFAEDEALPLLEGRAELIERPRSTRSARVIDFGAARTRLRPVATR